MSRLQSRFLQSYFLGEGLSGFIPAVIGLIQGIGNVDCDGPNPIYGEGFDQKCNNSLKQRLRAIIYSENLEFDHFESLIWCR